MTVPTPHSLAARLLPHRRNDPGYHPLDDGWYSAMIVDGTLTIHLGRSGSLPGKIEDFEIRPVGRRQRQTDGEATTPPPESPEELAAARARRLAASRWFQDNTVNLMLHLMTGGAARLCTDQLSRVPERYRAGEEPWEDAEMEVRRLGELNDPILVACPSPREAEVLADLLNRIELAKGEELLALD